MDEVLNTSRLALRKFLEEDALHLYNLNHDPSVIQFTGDSAFSSIEEARIFIKSYSHYNQHGYGRSFIGWCGLKYHTESGDVDLGFRLSKNYWHQGYGYEAGLGCIQYAFNTLNIPRLIGRTMPENIASIKLLEKLGMSYFHNTKLELNEWLVYEIIKPTIKFN